jgi:hypothetical protein
MKDIKTIILLLIISFIKAKAENRCAIDPSSLLRKLQNSSPAYSCSSLYHIFCPLHVRCLSSSLPANHFFSLLFVSSACSIPPLPLINHDLAFIIAPVIPWPPINRRAFPFQFAKSSSSLLPDIIRHLDQSQDILLHARLAFALKS